MEHDGSVVVDHIGACELLAQFDGDGYQQPAEILLLAPGEEFLEPEGAALLLLLEGGLDVEDCADHVRVVGLFVGDGGGDLAGFVVAVVLDEPAGGLGEADDLENEEDGEYGLESEREAPLERRFREARSVVHPTLLAW